VCVCLSFYHAVDNNALKERHPGGKKYCHNKSQNFCGDMQPNRVCMHAYAFWSYVCIILGACFVAGFNVNVMDLYHGTMCPLDQICAEGLDPRISVHGHFGRGIYFRFTVIIIIVID